MRTLLVIVTLLLAVPPARGIDGISVQLGSSDSSNASVDTRRIGIQWDWAKRWDLGSNWHIGGYWDLGFARWSNHSPERTSSSVSDRDFTPVFRLQQTSMGALSLYLEAAIGFHLLSQTSVNVQRRLGTTLQFGDHVGIGIRFGAGAHDLGYRYQHLSNGDIKAPNQGINFHQLRFRYHF